MGGRVTAVAQSEGGPVWGALWARGNLVSFSEVTAYAMMISRNIRFHCLLLLVNTKVFYKYMVFYLITCFIILAILGPVTKPLHACEK